MHEPRLVVDCLVAACTSALAIVVLRRFAVSLGLVDHPDQRKQHIGDVPLVGGLAIFMGVAAGAAGHGQFQEFEMVLLGTAAVLVMLGALDDRFDLSVRDRLLIQTIVILTVIASTGVYIHTLGTLFGHKVALGWTGVPLTVIAVIGLVNAFNMMDGIDGLAGSLELVSIAAIILFADPTPLHGVIALLALLAAASLPYLVANQGFMGGKIFLGDAGSMLIGYLLAWALIRMSQIPQTQLSPVNVLWCVALPVFDTFAVMYRRMRQGRSPFKPDRGHIHHILLGTGLGPRTTLAALVALASSLALIGAFISSAAHSAGTNLATFCVAMGVYAVTVTHVWLRQEARQRGAPDSQHAVDAAINSSNAVRESDSDELAGQKDGLMLEESDKTEAYGPARRSSRR
ncbi:MULTISPECIES: undecaprenyl/decaprenyl-phosphate alpha-N-acetylglucosaminyl 1-phosphate transferase [unclassified Rhodanobacter]|uniref:undecaprenyl/decaprenyl-phosphate alpha-N-acetylglucosaminyl 1-phosphate transferase n=1 Tax=unclassified Rhodanobacter TaxID=2621553 RepID=UPI001BE0C24F|nr:MULTISPECIES: undecaprenyl/decaprenyl-phosphate alpha-N-acetylglucosaminyl 1-phosphate transferase [unclassified Rhodanobacter]MBT2145155.1 undecaprenyl/decaprenyl-phosphate alpha-N-acetylglucosaminyl 1-phosphate transferase [Rhodanobacter sp. LX-99]MBT2149200.1 undecaprenyl/decaprenyl-phosphate alpha-N-acetylglucosaminyl 1-phosphate transferase [Rhodanobacter sp. LX-100]